MDKNQISRSMKMFVCWELSPDFSCLLLLPYNDFIAFMEQISEESDTVLLGTQEYLCWVYCSSGYDFIIEY